jgi:primosomal protein N'
MNGPVEGYITLQEAADLLGVSRPTMYRRALAAEQSVNSAELFMNSNLNSAEQPVNSKPASIVHDKKRYVSIDWALAEMDAAEPVNSAEQAVNSKMNSREQPVNSAEQSLNSAEQAVNSTLNSSADRIRQLEKDLLAAQGEAATLRATVTAQEAHIESLKTALDREQALHMASLQQRLPAGRGSSFMDWVKGWGKKQQ